MSQLLTLIWLKWRLLRNSLRSSKAVANKAASILGTLLALTLALAVALILGAVAFALTHPSVLGEAFRSSATRELEGRVSTEFIFFSIFGILYLMWGTVPLSIGGSKQFDAGKLLLYPITLRKLFAVDFASEFTTLHSVFAVPSVLAIAIGVGLGSGNLTRALIVSFVAILFGVALSKWLSTIIASLVKRKRARGETIIALLGAVVGLGAAVAGQLAPIVVERGDSFQSLRWTPPGAVAFLLVGDPTDDPLKYAGVFIILSTYAVVLVVATFWIARRSALGLEGPRKRKSAVDSSIAVKGYSGWQLPLASPQLSAIVEKEFRYAMRNAQVRMIALMPLILIFIRLVNSRALDSGGPNAPDEFLAYGSGLLATGGVLYVFLILAGLSCNQFAFEEGGMRTFILSPVDRRKILLGKNITVTFFALLFSIALLIVNAIVFRDLKFTDLVFVALSFVSFATISAIAGNWMSLRFPKYMAFGKRMNVSGITGILLIPLIVVLALPPLIATLVGYLTQSLVNQYLTLLVLALASVGLYFAMINVHGRDLARLETGILETIRAPSDE